MDRIRLIKDSVLYALAVLLYIPLRPLSLIIQLFNYMFAQYIDKGWKSIVFVYGWAMVFGPDLMGYGILFHDRTIDIPRLIRYWQLTFANMGENLWPNIIGFAILALVMGWLNKRYMWVLLEFPVWLKELLLRFSKELTRNRLVKVEKDIRAIRNGGMYNIETFKKKYMAS